MHSCYSQDTNIIINIDGLFVCVILHDNIANKRSNIWSEIRFTDWILFNTNKLYIFIVKPR